MNVFFIVLAGAILFIMVLFLFCRYREGFEENIYFLTFGAGGQNYYDAVNRITEEIRQLQIFHPIKSYTDVDLDDEFTSRHAQFIKNNKRGYGYWLWKPYLIMKTLEEMQDNEIMLYLDAGCEVRNDVQGMMGLIEQCKKEEIVYSLTGHDEKSHTKMDLILALGMNTTEYKDGPQYQATAIFLKKTPKIVELVKEWYSLGCNYHFIDDSPSVAPNDIHFIEHRHDQSTFSLLVKKYKYTGENHIFAEPNPIQFSRRR